MLLPDLLSRCSDSSAAYLCCNRLPLFGSLHQTSKLTTWRGSSFQISVPHPSEPAAWPWRGTGTPQHPSSAPFSHHLLLGDGQQREKPCGKGSWRAGMPSLFAEGENLVFSFRNPLPQALEFEVMLSGFAQSRSVIRAFCCSQCFAATVSWKMLWTLPSGTMRNVLLRCLNYK